MTSMDPKSNNYEPAENKYVQPQLYPCIIVFIIIIIMHSYNVRKSSVQQF